MGRSLNSEHMTCSHPLPRLDILNAGFTLIEVLVALAILAVALSAIISLTRHQARSAAYLQQKSQAAVVLNNVIATLRLKPRSRLVANLNEQGELQAFKRSWFWQINPVASPATRVFAFTVTVAPQGEQGNGLSREVLLNAD